MFCLAIETRWFTLMLNKGQVKKKRPVMCQSDVAFLKKIYEY